MADHQTTLFIAQIVLMLIAGRLLGEVMQRIGQPAVMGQLLAGIILGPSVFGVLWPDAQAWLFPDDPGQKKMITAVAELGILTLLLLTGMETDLSLVKRVGRAAASVSVAGIAIPFACGVALGEMLPASMLPHPEARLVTSLFLGTSLSISSVKIVAMVLREMHFFRRNLGQVIVASAVIDDTIGWIIIAIIFGIALNGGVDALALGKSVIGTAIFLVASFTLGRRLVARIIRWTNDHLVSEFAVLSAILAVTGIMALITDAIGVHSVLGAFVAGILVGQSPILTRQIDEQLRGLIMALFTPVFFAVAGLNADLTVLADPRMLALAAGFVAIASVGKFAGAFIGGTLGGLSRRESFALACGMNARGSTEVIVASIGLSMGALDETLYTMIVAMAILTTMAMPPMLRWALARLPMSDEERERLEREAFEAKGFVPRIERMLVAVDGSASGSLASRLAGLFVGSRQVLSTVLDLSTPRHAETLGTQATASEPRDVVKDLADRAVTAEAVEVDPSVDVDVAEPAPEKPLDAAVAEEARKGFDLLVVGLAERDDQPGNLHPQMQAVLAGFEGPCVVTMARGRLAQGDAHAPRSVLVAITGTDQSQRAAEFAYAITRAADAKVTAMYVGTSGSQGPARRMARAMRMTGPEDSILREAVHVAERFGLTARTLVSGRIAPEDALVHAVRHGKYDLVVLGVSRRPGDRVFFGETATRVLEQSRESVALVVT